MLSRSFWKSQTNPTRVRVQLAKRVQLSESRKQEIFKSRHSCWAPAGQRAQNGHPSKTTSVWPQGAADIGSVGVAARRRATARSCASWTADHAHAETVACPTAWDSHARRARQGVKAVGGKRNPRPRPEANSLRPLEVRRRRGRPDAGDMAPLPLQQLQAGRPPPVEMWLHFSPPSPTSSTAATEVHNRER